MHVDQAKSRIVRVQIAAALLGAGAVGAAFVPVQAPDLARIEVPVTQNKVEVAAVVAPIDPTELAGAADTIAPPVVVVAKPEAPKASEPPPPPPPPPWRYLGSLITPGGLRALVSVNDRQRFVREGDTVDGAKVLTLAVDHLMISREDKQERIDLAPRQSGALKLVTGGAAAMGGANPGAIQNATQAAITAAQIAAQRKLASRDPAEQARFDNMMARMERVDMMERGGRIAAEVAEKARDILKNGSEEEFHEFMRQNMGDKPEGK